MLKYEGSAADIDIFTDSLPVMVQNYPGVAYSRLERTIVEVAKHNVHASGCRKYTHHHPDKCFQKRSANRNVQ